MRKFSPYFRTCLMTRSFPIALIGLLLSLSASAQVFFQNTMFSYNRIAYNPAYAGMTTGTNFTLMGRQQWVGIQGAPQTYNLTMNTPAPKLGGGIGATLISDRLGPLSTTSLNVAYAYNLRFGANEQFALNFGASGGFGQKSLNGNFTYSQAVVDPLLPQGNYSSASKVVPNLGAGVHFSVFAADGVKEKFFVGLSGIDLLEPSYESLFQTAGNGSNSSVPRTFMLYTGYCHQINEKASFQPMVSVYSNGQSGVSKVPFQMNVATYFNLKPVVVGASYRLNDSFSGMMGAEISDRLFMAYSYDYTLTSLNAVGGLSTHELIISYTLPAKTKAKPFIIDTYNSGSQQ